jgi:hypothetical protein
MIQINFIQYPSYTNEIVFDGISYIIKFVWNTRGEFWTISFFDINYNPILLGLKLVLNYSLLKDFHYLALPTGELCIFDSSSNNNKIAYEDFTNERQLQLLYIPKVELETI